MKKWNVILIVALMCWIMSEGVLACEDNYDLNENVTILDVVEKSGEGASCQIWIYFNNSLNQSGNMSRNGLSYLYDAGVLDQGVYTSSIECNLSSVVFLGECKFSVGEEDKVIIGIVILIPLILSIFLLIWAGTLSKEHGVLKIFLSLLGVGVFFVAFHFGLISVAEYYGFTSLQDSIGNTVYWMSWTFVVIVTYFILYGLYTVLHNIREKKKRDLEY